MRWPVAILFIAGLTTTLTGCRTPPRKDLVEAELRVKDQDLSEIRSELERTEAYNQYLQRELRNTHNPIPSAGVPGPGGHGAGGLVEAVSPASLRSIILARQTGGIDDDGVPGDEALQVVIEPRDADNHTVKAPGAVQVQALEVTTEGLKKPIGAWRVEAEAIRKSWRSGLLSTGYYLVLPWKVSPSTTKVRVVVQFFSQDERLFEADRDVAVRLVPVGQRKDVGPEEGFPAMPFGPAGPAMPPSPVLPAPKESPTLPQPHEIEPPVVDRVEKVQKADVFELPIALILPPMPPLQNPVRPLQGAVELLRPVVLHD